MTGAVGAAIEGMDFMKWAWTKRVGTPIGWNWSPRGCAVISALVEHHLEDSSSVFLDNPPHAVTSQIEGIVKVNDKYLRCEANALSWIDKAIAAVAAQLPVIEPDAEPVKKRKTDLSFLEQVAVQEQELQVELA